MAEAGAKCGTTAGRMQHVYDKTPPCGPCKKAAADYKREWNKRGRCAPGLGWPLLPGKEARDG